MTLFVVTLEGEITGESFNPFVNVFTYDLNTILADSETCLTFAQAFWQRIVTGTGALETIVSLATIFTRVVVTVPSDPSALGIYTDTVVGDRTGSGMPRFVAWGFKSERKDARIRAGFKRFGLVSESDTAGSEPSSTFLPALETFADNMSVPIEFNTSAGGFIATPVIVKRVPYTTPSGSTAYRLPTGLDPYIYYVADNWDFQALTTQNSRKS